MMLRDGGFAMPGLARREADKTGRGGLSGGKAAIGEKGAKNGLNGGKNLYLACRMK